MGIEATGTIHTVFETKQVSERFTKREFVLEIADNPKYPQTVLFQATGDRCAQLNTLSVGDRVKVEFSLRGREWRSPKGETKYFNSLDVWKVDVIERAKAIEAPNAAASPGSAEPESTPVADDDIPFATCSLSAEPSPIASILRGGV